MDKAEMNERMYWFLTMMEACKRFVTDGEPDWVDAFCDDTPGEDPDTFNCADLGGFIRTTHDVDTGTSISELTDRGRKHLEELRAARAAMQTWKPPAVCDGKEQEAFEKWALGAGYDMRQHPLHYLFTEKSTSSARDGWKAAISYVRRTAPFPLAVEEVDFDYPALVAARAVVENPGVKIDPERLASIKARIQVQVVEAMENHFVKGASK